MKYFCFLLLLVAASCSNKSNNAANQEALADKGNTQQVGNSGKQLTLPVLDLKKEYPKKTVYLQDIADVEYIVLETHEDGLINGDLNHVTDSLIIVKNGITDNVVFFHRNGKYSHSFNRKGPSEKEYSSMSDICVNPHLKEIYINDFSRSMIQVYSYEGEYLRTLKMKFDKFRYGHLFYIDSNNLLWEDITNVDYEKDNNKTNLMPYYKVSIKDGTITQLPIKVEKRIRNSFNFYDKDTDEFISIGVGISPVANINGELILTDFAMDTLYTYRNDNLIPIAKKENWWKSNETPYLVTLDAITNKYYLWYAIEKNLKNTLWPDKTFLQDRYTGKCIQVKLADKNITDEKWRFRHRMSANKFILPHNHIMQFYPAYKLIELYEDGKLQGELKEIAAKLKLDDNPVLMLAKFK